MTTSRVPSTPSVDTGTRSSVSAEHDAASDFSLCTGGPVYFAGFRLGIAGGARNLWQFGVVIAVLTWLPLAILDAITAPQQPVAISFLSSNYAEQILYANVPLQTFAVSLTAAVVGGAVALLVPLAFFMPRLIDAKQRGLLEYGTLASHYTRAFAAKWLVADQPAEPMLGTADIQSLADLGNSFGQIRNMSALPIARQQIIFIVIAGALPFLPLLLTVFPLDELIINSMKSVINI